LTAVRRKNGEEIVSALHSRILQFTGGALQDDLALLAIKR
jgi:hypothetical protein